MPPVPISIICKLDWENQNSFGVWANLLLDDTQKPTSQTAVILVHNVQMWK